MKPTIYEALKLKLGREPNHQEITKDVKRILDEALINKTKFKKKKSK